MKLTGAPFCSGESFAQAFDVLQEARVDKPAFGFDRPFYAPGGYYGACWWSLDYALACEGVKWIRFDEALNLIHNLRRTQCTDGRVKLYGADRFEHIPSVCEPVASLPKYFETCFSVARMSGDLAVCREAAALFEDSLTWWRRNRLDERTGLFSAVFEETFIPNTVPGSGVYAPVDTNLQLAAGMEHTADLLDLIAAHDPSPVSLEFVSRAEDYRKAAQALRENVQERLWDDRIGAYFPLVLTQNRLYPALMGSTFMGISLPGEARRDRLEALLLDDTRFGWDGTPINSVARTDPLFTAVLGNYNGNPSWSGSVWTLINEQAVRALRAAGRSETACQLAIKTVEAFAGNYAEFLHPFTRSGEGVRRYAWSAAQCIRLVVEEIFGLRYDGFTGSLSAEPLFCPELRGIAMCLEGLPLPDGRIANAKLLDGTVYVSF